MKKHCIGCGKQIEDHVMCLACTELPDAGEKIVIYYDYLDTIVRGSEVMYKNY